MAMTCAHCRSADVAPLFRSYVCFACGKHTTDDGHKILPDSLCAEPNHSPVLEQFGWPYDETEPSVKRGEEICSEQWGTPLSGPVPATGGEVGTGPAPEEPVEEVPA